MSTSAPCFACYQPTTKDHPLCNHCGRWQPWGDQALADIRVRRLQEFREAELREEREWMEVRSDPAAAAPPVPTKAIVKQRAHFLGLNSGRVLATVGAAVVLFGSGLVVGRQTGNQASLNATAPVESSIPGFNPRLPRTGRLDLQSHTANAAAPIDDTSVAPFGLKPGKTVDVFRNGQPPTALCNDETLSFSKSRSGACSGHGGVKVFYK